jgi:S-adenosyl-L-methionine hydrolase (adenosine-forming)
MTSLITLTTDFGTGSPYVAAMRGVILGMNPAARVIDISHEIPPQDVQHAAIVLAESTPWFPAGTIHVAVIDPGVGTARRLIYVHVSDQHYLAPDNGVLSLLAKRNRPTRIIELANAEYWLPEVSHTFHGRDVLAPVAAQLSLGLERERLGPPLAQIQTLDWPEPVVTSSRIEGAVRWIDRFGNLITNITASMLAPGRSAAHLTIDCAGHEIAGLSECYGQHSPGTLAGLVGSSGYLEIAVAEGSAARVLSAMVGTPVAVRWQP